MASLNRVFLMGNLTRDPEIRYTQAGMAITRLGLAVSRRIKDPATNQWRDDVDFVDVVMFGRRAEVISEYFRKGDPIFVEGRLKFRSWETQNGERRNKLEVVAENFEFLGGRGRGASDGSGGASARQAGTGGGGQRPAPAQKPSEEKPSEEKPPEEEAPPYDESAFADDDVPF
jgi:single-strand DNA-binding protein